MAEAETVERNTKEDRVVLQSVARALWRADLAPKSSPDDRKASWTDHKAKYTKEARQLVRTLEGSGITLSVTKAAEDDSDED